MESLSIRTQLPRLFVEYTLNKQHVPLLRKAFLYVLSSVACPPGMFSPPKNRQCFLCPVGTYSLTYGALSCTHCKDGMTTKDPGAISMLFCVKEEMTKQGTQICYWSRAGRGPGDSELRAGTTVGPQSCCPKCVGHGNFYSPFRSLWRRVTPVSSITIPEEITAPLLLLTQGQC